ncbi:MAG: deoxyribonuclease IV [Planctomycetaceae bacterium]
MPLLGAHMSIAGGYYKAVEAARSFGMQTVQIFTKNNNQWRAKPLGDDDVRRFREAVRESGVRLPCAHSSYLINLASPDGALWRKSLDAFVVELERADALGLAGLVIHPGSYTASTPVHGLEKIVKAIDVAVRKTAGLAVEIWLETTAGQGTNLGWRFDQLGWIVDNASDARGIGICVDTCHLFAAGYRLKTATDFNATMSELDAAVGLDRVRAFHLNDSKRERGSRVDRHEHIGAGKLGREPFRHVLNDSRFARLPMYLETPKGARKRDGKAWDAINLGKLRRLCDS